MWTSRSRVGSLALLLLASSAVAVGRVPTEKDLVEVRDLAAISVSPDGRFAAFLLQSPSVERDEVELDWYVVAREGWSVEKLSSAGEPIRHLVTGTIQSSPPVWAADGRSFYYRALRRGEIQVWQTFLDHQPARQITDDAADVISFVLDAAHDRIYYEVGADREAILDAEAEEERSGFLLDETVPRGASTHNGMVAGRVATLRLRKGGLGYVTLLGERPPRLKVLELRSGSVREANEQDRQTFQTLQRRGLPSVPKGRHVAQDAESGALALIYPIVEKDEVQSQQSTIWQVQVHRPDGTVVNCTHSFCTGLGSNLRDLAWTNRGKALLIATEENGRAILRRWTLANDRVDEILNTEGSFTGTERWNIDVCPELGDALLCIVSAATEPPRLVAIPLGSGRRTTVFDPNPALRSLSYGRTELFEWSMPDGKRFNGILEYPVDYRKGRRYPLVISSYRCRGYLRGGAGDDLPEHVLAGHGLMVLCANQNAQYSHARDANGKVIPAYGYATVAESWEAAIDALDRRGLIDPSKVGIHGFSYSGHAVLHAISHSRRFAAAVSGSGSYFDPDQLRTSGALANSQLLRTLQSDFGLPWPDDDHEGVYARLSPALRAREIDTPLLLHLKEREAALTAELRTNLTRFNKPYEAYLYPRSAHYIQSPAQQFQVYRRSLDWFRFWLQGYEEPDPARAPQYERWRELRMRRVSQGG
jgi:dipeptidyl aminopeptidase/acylaminoacyl peptidase